MNVSGNLLEKIVETRNRLEKRFSDFESALLQKRSFAVMPIVEDLLSKPESAEEELPSPEKNFSESKSSGTVESELYAELHKKVVALSKEKESLELTVENLRKSLQTMAEERNELLQEMAKVPESSAEFPFGEQLLQLNKKREKSVRVWKAWHNKYRALKKMIQGLEQERQMNFGRITALSTELDTALEHIAELRDELHSLETAEKLGGKNG